MHSKKDVRLASPWASQASRCLLVWAQSESTACLAQVLNFSIAYGKTAHGLSRDWGTSLEEARDTVERWYSDRPEARTPASHVLSRLDVFLQLGYLRLLLAVMRMGAHWHGSQHCGPLEACLERGLRSMRAHQTPPSYAVG